MNKISYFKILEIQDLLNYIEYVNSKNIKSIFINFNIDNAELLQKIFNFILNNTTYNKLTHNSINKATSNFLDTNITNVKVKSKFQLEYWYRHGYTDINFIKQKINKLQCEQSIWSKHYWIKKGLTEEDAKLKISEIQSNISLRYNKKPNKKIKSVWNYKYWISKGYSIEDAKLEVLKRNPSSIHFYNEEYLYKEKCEKISKLMKDLHVLNPEKYMKFMGGKSKEEDKFFEELKCKLKYDIKYRHYYINVAKDIRTPNTGFIYDGCITLDDKHILIEYDGEYWHNEENDILRDNIVFDIRPDVIGIIRIKSRFYYKYKDEFKIIINNIEDGIERIKDKKDNRIIFR